MRQSRENQRLYGVAMCVGGGKERTTSTQHTSAMISDFTTAAVLSSNKVSPLREAGKPWMRTKASHTTGAGEKQEGKDHLSKWLDQRL